MKKWLSLSLIVLSGNVGFAQSYTDSIYEHRAAYKKEFVTDEHSPLKADDTAFIRFFAPNEKLRIIASVLLTPEAKSFQIPTHSGKTKIYRKYCEVSFKLEGKSYKLEVYQSPELIKKEAFKNHLFIPFNDLTNYEETYGGGRYLDLSLTDIHDNTLVLDFNKCYNPYCAYAEGYNCPIPPEANRLPIRIEAGEMMFGKKIEE